MMDLGKMRGQTGVNLVEVKRSHGARTATLRGDIVPAVVTVFDDWSFEIRLKTPPTMTVIRKALGGKGSARPGHDSAGSLTLARLRRIAERKLPDLTRLRGGHADHRRHGPIDGGDGGRALTCARDPAGAPSLHSGRTIRTWRPPSGCSPAAIANCPQWPRNSRTNTPPPRRSTRCWRTSA